jgi:hypothetical protein
VSAGSLLITEPETGGLTPARFERWYLAERLPALMSAGGFQRGNLFVRLGPDDGGEVLRLPGRYLAVFESVNDTAAWCRTFVLGVSDLSSATGIHVVMVNNTAPDRDREFNAWYNGLHLADVMAAGGYRSGSRYENTAPAPGDARWLALYETDAADPRQARARVAAAASGMRLWPHIEQVHVAVYARVEPTG